MFHLDTTNVAPGTSYTYTLSGVDAQDVASGSLTGTVTLDSQGKAAVAVALVADHKTEGAETMTMTLAGKTANVTVNDTSLTPALVLTTATDVLTGDATDNTFFASGQTLQTADSLDGKGGNDTLLVSVDDSTGPVNAAPHMAGIETIRVNAPNVDTPAITIDLSNASGVTALESYQVSDFYNEGGFVEFLDIQNVSATSIKIVDTNVDHEFTYDKVNAYQAGKGNDIVNLTLQEVDDSVLTFSNDRPYEEAASNVERINLTSLDRVQVSATTENTLHALRVGNNFETLVINGDADLDIHERLDRNVNLVDAGALAADLSLSLHVQGVALNGNGTVNAANTTVLNVIGAQGNDSIGIGGDLRSAGITVVDLGTGNDSLVLGDSGALLGHATIVAGEGEDTIVVNQTGLLNVDLGLDDDSLVINGDVEDLTTTARDGVSVVVAGVGDDTVLIEGDGAYDINLGAGDDNLTKHGNGNNTIVAGAGNDSVTIVGTGNTSNNNVDLGAGNDSLVIVDNGSNSVLGGTGSDSVTIIGDGNQTVNSGDDSDSIVIVGDGNDSVIAGTGDDEVTIVGTGKQNVDLGTGNDSLTIDGSASGNLDYASASLVTTIVAGDGNDTVDVTADHILNANLGAGNDELVLRAQDLTTDDTVVAGAGTDTLVLTNEGGDAWEIGRSETSRTTGFEVFDLHDHALTLDVTNQMVATAEGNSITVSTQDSTATELPVLHLTPAAISAGATQVPLLQGMTVAAYSVLVSEWRNGQVVEGNAEFGGNAKAHYDSLSFTGTPAQVEAQILAQAAVDLADYLEVQGVTLAPTDTNADGDTTDAADQIFFILNNQDLTQTVDLTGLDTNLPDAFTLLGGSLTDIVIAKDELINGRMTLNFDSTSGNALSTNDTLRVVDGATITAADLRNVTGLEVLDLVSVSNHAQTWTIELTDRVVNQTTANADLVIRVSPDVPAGSVVRIKLDPASLAHADSDVIVERNSNVTVLIDIGDGHGFQPVSEPAYDSEVQAFNGSYGLYVVSEQHFTTNADNLSGTFFVADSVDQVQAADIANGVGEDATVHLNFAVANQNETLGWQLHEATFNNINRIEFDTTNNVQFDGVFLNGDGNLNELATGSGDDTLWDVQGGVSYELNAGNDFVDFYGEDSNSIAVDGGAGFDTVEVNAFNANLTVSVDGVEFVTGFGEDATTVYLEGNASAATNHLVTITNVESIFGSTLADNVKADITDGDNLYVDMAAGNDTINVDPPVNATVIGGLGADIINVQATQTAVVYGDLAQPETAIAGQGADLINVDVVSGATVYAGAGNDTVTTEVDGNYGANANAVIFGESGDDIITLTTPHDGYDFYVGEADTVVAAVDGGSGNDTISVSAVAYEYSAVTVLGGVGDDSVYVYQNTDNGSYPLSPMTASISGGDGNDTIAYHSEPIGEDVSVVIDGGNGNDQIAVVIDDSASWGSDVNNGFDPTVNGGLGNDTITVNNSQPGDVGIVVLNGNEGDDVINVATDGWVTTITGGAGDDEINLHVSVNGQQDTLVFGNITYNGLQVENLNTQGTDAITGFNWETTGPTAGAEDVLNFSAFNGAYTAGDTVYDGALDGGTDSGQVNVVATANDSYILTNDNWATSGFSIADDGEGVLIIAKDTDGTDGYDLFDIYYVQDVDADAGIAVKVNLVGTIDSATNVGLASIGDGNFA